MMVADRDSQGVGGVDRAGWFGEIQKGLNHPLDLAFAGSAVPRHGTLDLQRRVLRDSEPALDCGEKDDSSHMAQLERALSIFCKDQRFDGRPLRPMAADQFGEAFKDLLQTRREWIGG